MKRTERMNMFAQCLRNDLKELNLKDFDVFTQPNTNNEIRIFLTHLTMVGVTDQHYILILNKLRQGMPDFDLITNYVILKPKLPAELQPNPITEVNLYTTPSTIVEHVIDNLKTVAHYIDSILSRYIKPYKPSVITTPDIYSNTNDDLAVTLLTCTNHRLALAHSKLTVYHYDLTNNTPINTVHLLTQSKPDFDKAIRDLAKHLDCNRIA